MDKLTANRSPLFNKAMWLYTKIAIAVVFVGLIIYVFFLKQEKTNLHSIILFMIVIIICQSLFNPVVRYIVRVAKLTFDAEKMVIKKEIFYYKDAKKVVFNDKHSLDYLGLNNRKCISFEFAEGRTLYLFEGLHTNYDEIVAYLKETLPAHLLNTSEKTSTK